uniref:Tetraspanin n=1 Tax=Crassostrea virginica TaxID=6565 RepID=A0A8B8CY15_CRAVI|nr:tetraspanin-9-like [Crassostrea virginica]
MGSTGACCAKLILGILNTLFLLVGLALIAVGSLVLVGADFLASVLKAFADIPVIANVITSAAWILIGLGIFLVLMGVLGGCGACCSIKTFLIAYVVVIVVLVLVEITFVALLFSDTLKNMLSDPVTNEIKKYKDILDSSNKFVTDPQSRAMDLLFINLKCCGWNDHNDLPSVPKTCCSSFSKAILDSADPSAISSIGICSDSSPTFYKKGCYKAVMDLIDDNKPMAVGILVGIFLFQILCIVFAIWIVKANSKVNPID